MAVNPTWQIERISLTSADPDVVSAFYCEALGFEQISIEEHTGDGFARVMGIADARAQARVLRLGQQRIDLMAFDQPGRPYPPVSTSSDLWFQHLAVVVSDMRAAYERLSAHSGWAPISTNGPQRLPQNSGGVTAFKFRDPEGHPLELLEFPPERTPRVWQMPQGSEPCLGIDHSAITVANTAISAAFYAKLGFSVCAHSLNTGIAQQCLDGIANARVQVTALGQQAADGPHLELLCYLPPLGRSAPPDARSNDVAATRLVLQTCRTTLPDHSSTSPRTRQALLTSVSSAHWEQAALLQDPDGHHLLLLR